MSPVVSRPRDETEVVRVVVSARRIDRVRARARRTLADRHGAPRAVRPVVDREHPTGLRDADVVRVAIAGGVHLDRATGHKLAWFLPLSPPKGSCASGSPARSSSSSVGRS